jgi:hypothetical protein
VTCLLLVVEVFALLSATERKLGVAAHSRRVATGVLF